MRNHGVRPNAKPAASFLLIVVRRARGSAPLTAGAGPQIEHRERRSKVRRVLEGPDLERRRAVISRGATYAPWAGLDGCPENDRTPESSGQGPRRELEDHFPVREACQDLYCPKYEEVEADLTLEKRLLKTSMSGAGGDDA
jgi:hypothetical protein